MNQDIQTIIIFIIGGIFLCLLTEILNRRTRVSYRISIENQFKKEFCPNCNVKMKKKYKKRILYSNESSNNRYKSKAYELLPEFFCKKCGYEIKAKNKYQK